MFEMQFKYSKLVKSIVFRCLQANKTVSCSQSIAYALRNRQGNRHLSKKMKKNNEKKNEKNEKRNLNL